MIRLVAALGCLLALILVVGDDAAGGQAQKNQMVKGTIKSVDTSKNVLIVNQKVKNEVVDRELSITPDTEFVVSAGGATKTASGNAGLQLVEGRLGAKVQVKCDKDVNVLKVTVKGK
jgi:hypothetical protein